MGRGMGRGFTPGGRGGMMSGGGRGGRGSRGGGRGGYQKPNEPQQHAGISNKSSPDLDDKSASNENDEDNIDQTALISALVPGEVGALDQIPGDETQNGEKTADGTAVIDEPSKNVISGQGKSKGQLALSAYQASSKKRPSSSSAAKKS